MKRKLLIIIAIFISILFLLSQFGIQIGNVRIGKQQDLKTKQSENFEESSFYKNYYSKDKLTVLNLWATWCEPCIGEMPILNSVQEKYKTQPIQFISFSIDTDSVKLVKFNNLNKFKFKDITIENLRYKTAILNTLEGKKVDKWIATNSVPMTYLLRDNKVLERIDGTIEKEELIKIIDKHK